MAPLGTKDEFIGILELGTSTPGKLNAINTLKLREVLDLFSVALERSLDELGNRVQAIIKEKYTAIHPTVEWKFVDAAVGHLHQMEEGKMAEAESLVFKDVIPLYGMADIRGSSRERNKSIQGDLIEQLDMAQHTLVSVNKIRELPVLDELSFRLQKHKESIREGLSSGDEIATIEFIQQEIDPVFNHLKEQDEALAAIIADYQNLLDPGLGILYKRRKAYEDSVTMLNDTIAAYIDQEQENAQEIFPHYFQRYKTDGVDYNMYVGQSLVNDKAFDPLYLKSLRLWQLITTAEITRIAGKLKKKLPVPLETAQLVLAYSNPLSIRFRLDEKQFDVDGAYNIRYEIVKKRIDKAYIKNTEERLTQPGMIAIVYSQDRDAVEYEKYVEYLQAKGYLEKNVEYLELEELQGVRGLKAMRVRVKTSKAAGKRSIRYEEIKAAV